jgi:hypothetical protein
MPSTDGWYDENPDRSQYYQGDILREMPFPSWPMLKSANEQAKWGILRPLQSGRRAPAPNAMTALPSYLEGRAARDVPDAFANPDGEYVIGKCRLQQVLVVSRSCALDNAERRKHLLIAPVTEIASLRPEERSEGKLLDLRANNIPHLFYLPGFAGLRESYANFMLITYLHRSFLDDGEISEKLLTRLSSPAASGLQMKLAEHFGMKFGFDHEDLCPQDGLYSCSNCFHSGNPTNHVTFRAGSAFGACPRCGENAAFVKMPDAK